MNRAYRTVWNAVTATWNVASELARSHAKKGASCSLATIAALGALAFVSPAFAGALDGGSASADKSLAYGTGAVTESESGLPAWQGSTYGQGAIAIGNGYTTTDGVVLKTVAAGVDATAIGNGATAD